MFTNRDNNLSSWLSKIDDDKKLKNVIFPGTDISAAYTNGIRQRLQDQKFKYHFTRQFKYHNYSLYTQLCNGIRILSFSLSFDKKDNIWVSNGHSLIPFSEVITTLQDFLSLHTTEFIIVYLFMDYKCKRYDQECLVEAVKKLKEEVKVYKIANQNINDVQIKKLRNKVVVFADLINPYVYSVGFINLRYPNSKMNGNKIIKIAQKVKDETIDNDLKYTGIALLVKKRRYEWESTYNERAAKLNVRFNEWIKNNFRYKHNTHINFILINMRSDVLVKQIITLNYQEK